MIYIGKKIIRVRRISVKTLAALQRKGFTVIITGPGGLQ